ncbi:MAG: hypothetical protein KJ601_02010 [Nanoarchaeota archaeon]|nr:hypothetical protein [Nanoarchaeota archaeon]MBU1704227.1 hypothetical protein [Nanoarchaeota archaeon]
MLTEEDLEKYGFEPEYGEENRKVKGTFTHWPKPYNRKRIYVEGYNISVEEPYFWVLQYLRYMVGYPDIIKITDIFAAAENSAFFGASQQRLGVQQDKVSQYLATVGKMVKELFQLVRELRILDERLDYYVDSLNPASKSMESAEITLKGIWVDMVEQGAKNPASVYGMAREVQFTTLPDLFFSTHPLKQEDVDVTVEKERGQFNRKVREVLKRKLRSFLTWKEHTFEEMKTRRVFTLKYLRQHYEIIRMYMAWVKPYLKNVQRLQMDQEKMDSADIISFFETSMMEIEILCHKPAKNGIHPVVSIHYLFRTRPEMNYQQEGYQRGPIHVGRVQMNFRSYGWTKEQIQNYQAMKTEEDFKLLGVVDTSVQAALDALGDELMDYLIQAGDQSVKKKTKSTKSPALSPKQVPKVTIMNSFKQIFKSNKPAKKEGKKLTSEQAWQLEGARKAAEKTATASIGTIYEHFKKHHGLMSW